MSHEPADKPVCRGCQQRDERIAELEGRVVELERQLEEMRQKLEQSEQAGKRQAAPFRRTEHKANPKKPGRRPGHRLAARPIPEHVDRLIDVPCDTCPDCHKALVDPVVHTQYQTDLPPVVPIVTRFDVHGGTCPCCKRYHQGRHPEMISDATGACANQVGPVALTMAAELKHRLGVPYRKITDFFDTYFRLRVSPATLVRAEQRLARKAKPTFDLLVEALRQCGIVHADETGWRVGRLNAWLWVFSSKTVTIYAIRDNRGHEVPEEILGPDFEGVLVVDGWSAYDVLECKKGRCLGHIARRCRNGIEQGPESAEAAELGRLLAILRRGMELADRYAEMAEDDYWREMRQWENDFDGWLLSEEVPAGEEARKVRKHLLEHHDEFMRFLLEPGVPATNNHAERMIRPAVPIRKTGGCNKTLMGACVHGVLASLMVSVHQQGKRFVDLALRLWREPEVGAIDLGTLPAAPRRPAPVADPPAPVPTVAFAPSG